MKEQISDYFAGVVTYDISIAEQLAHDRLVKEVRKATWYLLRYETDKIKKQIKVG